MDKICIKIKEFKKTNGVTMPAHEICFDMEPLSVEILEKIRIAKSKLLA